METGYFYYLTDSYYTTFENKGLMPNKPEDKKSKHDRPCFYAINDLDDPKIMWMVPISSKVEKYKRIEKEKIEKYHIKTYNGVEFGQVLGHQRAFLIQNICPVITEYIDQQYFDSSNNPVKISDNIRDKVIKKARQIIALSKKGIKCTLTDINFILSVLSKR